MLEISPGEVETVYPITDSDRVERKVPDDPTAECTRVCVLQTPRLYAVQLIHSAAGTDEDTKTFEFDPGEARTLADQIRSGDTSFTEHFNTSLATAIADELELAASFASTRSLGEIVGEDTVGAAIEGKITDDEFIREFSRNTDEMVAKRDRGEKPSFGAYGDVDESEKDQIRDTIQECLADDVEPMDTTYLDVTGPFTTIEINPTPAEDVLVNAYLPVASAEGTLIPDDPTGLPDEKIEELDFTQDPTTLPVTIPDRDYYATFVRAVAEAYNATSYTIHEYFTEEFYCTSVLPPTDDGDDAIAVFTTVMP